MTLNFAELTRAWQQVDALTHGAVAPIETETDLAAATAHLEAILGEIGEKPSHPLDSLAKLLIERITTYEAAHFPMPDAQGPELLAFLMEQKPLTQKELAAATGLPQSTISDLVNRKRQFTADHARKLGDYFKVSAGVFL